MTRAPVGSRRERLRDATLDEITAAARRQLAITGAAGLSLRAIAREIGMTAPALYRYVDSREALIELLITQAYDDLALTLENARDSQPPDAVSRRLIEVSRAFRRWAMTHPPEFALTFGSPLPGFRTPPDSPAHQAGRRFGAVFAGIFGQLWSTRPFPTRAVQDPRLREQLEAYGHSLGGALPVDALQVFLECWTKLYGHVSMECFGHLSFALIDPEPLFEQTLRDLAVQLGTTDGFDDAAAEGESRR